MALGLGLGLIGFGAGASSGGGPPLLLDGSIATASNAYSLRKLRTAYAGNCIKVRRSSDSTTQNIGFSGNGLDTTALLAFCGGGNGFIDTWYDQVGSADMVQATAGLQPRIVTSGAVETKNSLPVIFFININDSKIVTYGTTLQGVSQFTASAVAYSNNTIPGRIVTFQRDTGNYVGWDESSADTCALISINNTTDLVSMRQSNTIRATTSYTANQLMTALSLYDATNNYVAVNGTLSSASAYAQAALATTSTPNASIGNDTSGNGKALNGGIGEVILWASALSSGDRSTLQANQKAYWGTP